MSKLGAPSYQVKIALTKLERFGHSKHQAKQHGAVESGIYSHSTRQDYQRDCSRFATWARDHHGVRDIRNLTPAMAREYLDGLAAKGRSGNYLGRVKAAIGKLSVALHGKKWDLGSTWHGDRQPEHAYTPQQAVLVEQNMRQHARDKQTADVVKLQRIAGLRRKEAVYLRGQDIDVERCILRLSAGTKGGRFRTVPVDAKHRGYLRSLKERAGKSKDGHVFRGRGGLANRTERAVSNACKRLGLTDHATHGFRKMFAQARYREYRTQGLTDRQARTEVARLLGHGRIEVTYSYVARKS